MSEYLVALENENPPTNPKQKPKALSPSDPSAAWTTRGRHKVMFGYSLNYLIDMENAVILDVEATPTRISKEVDATETMIERVAERFALKSDRAEPASAQSEATQAAAASASGIVFKDSNGNRRRDAVAPGLTGIRVSNGLEVGRTESGSGYSLPIPEGDILFVTKPSGYAVPRSDDMLPRFYYTKSR